MSGDPAIFFTLIYTYIKKKILEPVLIKIISKPFYLSRLEETNKFKVITHEVILIMWKTSNGGSMLKRLRPAPQGRAHRIRKRSNHVTIVVDALNNTQSN